MPAEIDSCVITEHSEFECHDRDETCTAPFQKIDDRTFMWSRCSRRFVFSQEVHDYFSRGGHSEIFGEPFRELCSKICSSSSSGVGRS